MPHYIGWTSFTCGHETSVKVSTIQQIKEHYNREYLSYQLVDTSGREYHASAPRPCKSCCQKQQGQQQPPVAAGYENFAHKWRTEWAPKIASVEPNEAENPPLKNLLHHICPHLRSVNNLREEVLLRRVNSQLKLEGVNISEEITPSDVDQETRQRVTRVVEDQLHMHRNAKLKESSTALRDSSVLQKAQVASARSVKVVQMLSSKRDSVAC
ncbi:hypothetical protein PFICI_07697 [Pestalotiopsis fici W106-1]|uniref:Uncharacterized protein n=1 Tax=Pestalotiopsis fici (strain W106-1 / CGMCC3.15140) TaxID=1229662 RepID=W3X211_PESFW|nr:uncharacterized protein PFICI_07697 [Pestalotiopsis fici W106-1]ETS80168.1 hypothetical protein PFICI_07697 [Pestalotiopsis fici W106-1]